MDLTPNTAYNKFEGISVSPKNSLTLLAENLKLLSICLAAIFLVSLVKLLSNKCFSKQNSTIKHVKVGTSLPAFQKFVISSIKLDLNRVHTSTRLQTTLKEYSLSSSVDSVPTMVIPAMKHKFKHYSHHPGLVNLHIQRQKGKSATSIFARFFYFIINLLFCSVKKKISVLFIEFKRLFRLKYAFYENTSSDIKYSLNFKIQSKLIDYNSY